VLHGKIKGNGMSIGKILIPALLLCGLAARGAAGKVLVRWTQHTIPAAKSLGVMEIAIPWSSDAMDFAQAAHAKGYQVYFEVPLQQAETTAEAAAKAGIAGLILAPSLAEQQGAGDILQKLRLAYPKVSFRILLSNGKEPRMKGQIVSQRNGVLQETSATAQPWVESNLALVRLAQESHLDQRPLYSFAWDDSDPLQKQLGRDAADYELAIAEAGAFHADLILELSENLQKSLANDAPEAWTTWKQVQRFVDFYHRGNRDVPESVASVAVWTGDANGSYEPVNLMARHNIPFRVLSKKDLSTSGLKGMDVLVYFSAPTKEHTGVISDFAMSGGTVVLVNAHGTFPWQSTTPARHSDQANVYTVGKGRVIEFSGYITDPETFAQDIRRLMSKERTPVNLWNSLTTLVVPYRDPRTDQIVLELINYEQEPLQVQVQVRGRFASVRYESPEQGCCEALTPGFVDGFTEFVVPHVVIGGRVHLQTASQKDEPAKK
jgi:hypothetical protein